jgi:hypothetical protein
MGRGFMDTGGRAVWGCPLDWISEGDTVGCVRSHGAVDGGPHAGASALCLRGFDENVPPIHLDGIRVAVVVVGDPDTHAVVLRSDSGGCGCAAF